VSKVFGIGLPQTGNISLGWALRRLGLRTMQNPTPFRQRVYFQSAYRCPRHFDAIVNFGEWFFPQLDHSYPSSKFICTERELENWVKSAKRSFRIGRRMAAINKHANINVFGCVHFHPGRFRQTHIRHAKYVAEYFHGRPDDLLVLRVEDNTDTENWEELCAFLGKPVPPGRFPHANRAGGRK